MRCDMCGSEGTLYKTRIEGAELKVCHECSKFGKVTGIVKANIPEKTKPVKQEPKKEILEFIVEDFAEKIKSEREKLGLKQSDFAKKLNEKESVIHKIETGAFTPSFGLARKLERFLNIKLVKQHEESYEKPAKAKAESFTIGDFIKKK